MTLPHDSPPRRTWWWGLRRTVRVLLLFIVALGLGGFYYFSEPTRLAFLAGQLLQQITGANAAIREARFNLDGTVELTNVRLTVPGIQGAAAELFTAEQIIIRIDMASLMGLKFVAQRMIMNSPVLSITEIGPDDFNYERLRELKMEKSPGPLPRLPEVVIRDGQVRYGDVQNGRYQSYGMEVIGQLTPVPGERTLYRFELHQIRRDDAGKPLAAAGPTLKGRFDVERLEVSAEVSDFALIDPHRTALPSQIRKWWDLFEPSGTFPTIKFDYDPKTGPIAEIEVRDIALTLPQLSTHHYKARMTQVSGSFRFTNDRIAIQALAGQIEGLHYQIDGRVDGWTADAPFQFMIKTRPFRIPEEPRYMVAMPLSVQRTFRQFSPVGWVRVSLSLTRPKAAAEVDYSGLAEFLSGAQVRDAIVAHLPPSQRQAGDISLDPKNPEYITHGIYSKFPYKLNNLHGWLKFDSKAIEVQNLTGDSNDGGRVTLNGTIAPPDEHAAYDIRITAVNVPLDQALLDALQPRHRNSVRMLLHQPSYDALLKENHIQTAARKRSLDARRKQLEDQLAAEDLPAGARADLKKELAANQKQSAVPVFELGGRGNALVVLHSDYGPNKPTDITVTIDLADARVSPRFFPYPLRIRSGRIIVMEGKVVVDSLIAEGLHGGRINIDGHLVMPARSNADDLPIPDISLKALGVPLDELLLRVLPQPQDQWVRALNLSGSFNAVGKVDQKGDNIDFNLALDLADLTAAPGGGKMAFDKLEGLLAISRRDLRINKAVARHGSGELSIAGAIDWSDREHPSFDLKAQAAAFRFEDPILDLIGPALSGRKAIEQFWETHKPAGLFDASLSYTGAIDRDPKYTLAITPRNLAFTRNGQRVTLQKTTGSIALSPGRITLGDLAAQTDGDSHVRLAGVILTEPEISADLKGAISGSHITPVLKQNLPAAITAAIDKINFDGRYEMTLDRIQIQPDAETGAWARIDGQINLKDASLQLGLPLTEFQGVVSLRTALENGRDQPRLAIEVDGRSMRFGGRLLENLRASVVSDEKSNRLLAPQIRGDYYGGRIDGKAAVDIDAGDYSVHLAFSDVDLRQFMAEQKAAAAPGPKGPATMLGARTIGGRASLSLSLDGSWKQETIRMGRGDLLVRDADLRGVPVAMNLLHISHLTLPGDNRFDRAAVGYYIRDNQVTFERIELAAPSVLLAGDGTMEYSTGAVDLTLTSDNPGGLKLGPVGQMIKGLRDQLITIRVTGTLDRPDVRVRQFDGITRAWRDVFGGSSNQ